MIKKFFAPPHFEGEDLNRKAIILNDFSWIAIGLLFIELLNFTFIDFEYTTIIFLSGAMGTMALGLFLLRLGYVNASGILAVGIVWIGVGFQAYTADGIYDAVILAYLVTAALAANLINARAAVIVVLLSIMAIWALAFFAINGQVMPTPDTPQNYARDLSIIFLLVAVMVYFMTTFLQNALKRARSAALELRKSNEELQVLHRGLEQ